MHEMAVVEDVLKVSLKHAGMNNASKIVSIVLRVGEMRDVIDEWMQRFFDFLSRGTIAEGAKLRIMRTPVLFRCACGETFPVTMDKIRESTKASCPSCNGKDTFFCSGREFEIIGIEVK
jgi:hydrogenase nickel incorporation protein HypA/HybF